MHLRDRIGDGIRHVCEFFQDMWFDGTRRVRTAGNVPLLRAGIAGSDQADSELYVPARPHHIREALLATGVPDFSGYRYVDLGSGKGRSLFVAAEFPFAAIHGVEFSRHLHEQAAANSRRFRYRPRGCATIEPLHRNAMEYDFPAGPLVLYLFNPFGRSTMQVVLHRLEQSLQQEPRHVVVVLLWPRCGDLVAQIPGMQQVCCTQHHQIFEANAPGKPAAS